MRIFIRSVCVVFVSTLRNANVRMCGACVSVTCNYRVLRYGIGFYDDGERDNKIKKK